LNVKTHQAAQRTIRWNPGKDQAHLQTRKERQHLSVDATLADYHAIIQAVLIQPTAQVFVYRFGERIYPTVVADVNSTPWLVMLASDGIMETAFVVHDPVRYLAPSQYEFVG
jgi:hypothetical protein